MSVTDQLAAQVRVGPIFPVATERTDEGEHRRILADAVNLIAAGFFTAQTGLVQQSSEDTISTTTFTDLSGLEKEVVSSVPARIIVCAELLLEITDGDSANGGEFIYRLIAGSTAFSTEMIYREAEPPAAANQTELQSVTVQGILDIDERTSYVIKTQAKGSTGNEVWKVRTPSTMLVRLEPRSLR